MPVELAVLTQPWIHVDGRLLPPRPSDTGGHRHRERHPDGSGGPAEGRTGRYECAERPFAQVGQLMDSERPQDRGGGVEDGGELQQDRAGYQRRETQTRPFRRIQTTTEAPDRPREGEQAEGDEEEDQRHGGYGSLRRTRRS